jgi:hypothetical protein
MELRPARPLVSRLTISGCRPIPSMTAPNRRATAFGILNAIFGDAWFAGSSLLGGHLRLVPRRGGRDFTCPLIARRSRLLVVTREWGERR